MEITGKGDGSSTFIIANRLRRLIEAHGHSLTGLAKSLGYPGLRNKFTPRRSASLTMDDIVRVLEFLGEPLGVFFTPEEAAAAEVPEAVRLLRRFRLVSEPESRKLARWVCISPKLEDSFPDAPMPAEVEDINQLRLRDLPAAQCYAERWVDNALGSAIRHTRRGPQEFILALGSWASVMRTAGKINDSALALEHALLLQSPRPFGRPWSSLLIKTAFTLRHLASREGAASALPLLHEAAGQVHLFVGSESREMLVVLRTIGDTSLYSRDWDLAERSFQSALRIEATALDNYINHYNLALLASFEGHVARAQACLHKAAIAVSVEELPSHFRFQHKWLVARLDTARGELTAARRIFVEELIPFSETQPLNRLLVFCDLASILMELREQEVLASAAHDFRRCLSKIPVSRTAFIVAESFLQVCEEALPERRLIEATRRRLENQLR